MLPENTATGGRAPESVTETGSLQLREALTVVPMGRSGRFFAPRHGYLLRGICCSFRWGHQNRASGEMVGQVASNRGAGTEVYWAELGLWHCCWVPVPAGHCGELASLSPLRGQGEVCSPYILGIMAMHGVSVPWMVFNMLMLQAEIVAFALSTDIRRIYQQDSQRDAL